MSRAPVCSSCGARLRHLERSCFQCGSRQPVPHEAGGMTATAEDVFAALTADEPGRIKSLIDRLVAAGVAVEPLDDLGAGDPDIEIELGGRGPLVAVRVLRADLERARAVEAEWLRERHPDDSAPLALEGNAAEACPACGALLTIGDASRCAACGAEIPAAEA